MQEFLEFALYNNIPYPKCLIEILQIYKTKQYRNFTRKFTDFVVKETFDYDW